MRLHSVQTHACCSATAVTCLNPPHIPEQGYFSLPFIAENTLNVGLMMKSKLIAFMVRELGTEVKGLCKDSRKIGRTEHFIQCKTSQGQEVNEIKEDMKFLRTKLYFSK